MASNDQMSFLRTHAIMSIRTLSEESMAQVQVIEGTGEELIKLLHQQPKERFRLIRLPGDHPIQTYEGAFAHALPRSPEEVAAARARVLQASPTPRTIPEGKTLEDMIMGQWPGEETDEQILNALEKLS